MANFTPISAAIGGALIGLAAVLLMLLTGRIAGVSGILGGCLGPGAGDKAWRIAFIAGLILAPLAGGLAGVPIPVPEMPASWGVIVMAGLLVGFGIPARRRLHLRATASAASRGCRHAPWSPPRSSWRRRRVVALTRHGFGG